MYVIANCILKWVAFGLMVKFRLTNPLMRDFIILVTQLIEYII